MHGDISMDLIFNIVFSLIISLSPSFAEEVSRACYGTPGLQCIHHNLRCSSGRIAIQEAFYTDSTVCGGGASNCVNINSIPLTGRRYNFNDTELDSLCGDCSSQSHCSLLAKRRNAIAFSAILYECINETIPMCNVTNIKKTDTSLIWRGPSDRKTCRCSISKLATTGSTVLTLTSLEMRPRCQAFNIYVDGNTSSIQCKHFTLKQVIFNSTNWDKVMMTANPDKNKKNDKTVIWIKIQASDNINIVCNHNPTTEATEAKGKHTTVPVVGITIPICIIIAGVVTGVIIYRRRKIRQKGEDGNVAKPKSFPQEVPSLEKKSSPDYDYTTTNEHLHLVSKAHNKSAPLKGSSSDDYAGKNANHEVKPQQLSTTSDYDYATCSDQKTNHDHPSSRNTQTRHGDNDHIGHQPARGNGHCDTTGKVSNDDEEVYSYNHLNEKASINVDVDPTYNTTSSTRHKMDSSTNDMDDDYGYNHLGTEHKKNLPQNEYDTTASAIRDLARMNGDMEDSTYDHALLRTSDSSPSGMTNVGFNESDYDHASSTTTVHKVDYKSNASPNGKHKEDGKIDVYTLAQDNIIDSNPYQLAK